MTLEMTRGDYREIPFQLTVSETDLTPRALAAGEIVRCTGKKKFSHADADAIFGKTSEDSSEISVDPYGAGVVILLPEDTKDLPNKDVTLEIDLQIDVDGDKPQTIIRDQLTVLAEVTQAPAP